ncbi:hypothetical protein ACHAWO_012367 [Cyclotella atomus]|uniref:Uncharacterized protein n=1 Tax=Cyclotella atomus TaxID=382360 RepID=A0ABD3NVH6_9STRA
MMMERVKTAPAPEEAAKPSTNNQPVETKPAPASSQERVNDLERRLNDLDSALGNTGGIPSSAVESVGAVKPDESAVEVQQELKPLELKEDVKPVEQHQTVVKPTEQKQRAVGTGKSNPLLQMPPPSLDALEQHSGPAPSAPPESPNDHLAGVIPMPAPIPPPPSFAEFEEQLQRKPPPETQLETDASFDFDVDGIPLSPEERQQMLEEQRRLYENIMKEKEANDIAIARASADAFDSRSPAAAARAEIRNEQMDSMGRDVDPRAADGPKTEGEETINEPRRFVQIGGNQTVALHGQERTKKAIKEGTALLVQCINCQNWMQVTATATLMFCPVCQVVCPVVKQTEVLTKEQAIQLTMDRKLAEKLQAEAYAANDTKKQESGYFARLFGSGETSTSTTTTTQAASGSWWDKLSSIVSYGVEEEPRQRGELGVTRPPGASETSSSMTTYPGQRRPPATVNESNEETRGLLSGTSSSMTTYPGQRHPVSTSPSNASNLHPVTVHGNEANLPAGRVAEQRPLLSCVYDSVSNVASSVFTTEEPDEDGNVYGVDARSLLAVTEREDDEYGEMT